MSIIKSYAVGNGDMFFINHDTDSFTIIDCCLSDENQWRILRELASLKHGKSVSRFISTHPDEDHIRGLELLHQYVGIENFYCVRNRAIKREDTPSFTQYCQLRDDSTKSSFIFRGFSRPWLNVTDDENQGAGISILWPNTENEVYKAALRYAELGGSPNDISAIVQYQRQKGATALWMGDIETDFLEVIAYEIALPLVDLLFAPHHGRHSGRIPKTVLDRMEPRLIIIGEAPSEHLCYYDGYSTICQNSAGDIIFDCDDGMVHIYTTQSCPIPGLLNLARTYQGHFYAGSLLLGMRPSGRGVRQ